MDKTKKVFNCHHEYITYPDIPGGYEAIFYNGVKLGEILADDDGVYRIWFEKGEGNWSSYILRLLCDKMEELNKPLEEEIERYFNSLECNND